MSDKEKEALGTRGRGSLHAGLRWEVMCLEKGGREGEKIRSERTVARECGSLGAIPWGIRCH